MARQPALLPAVRDFLFHQHAAFYWGHCCLLTWSLRNIPSAELVVSLCGAHSSIIAIMAAQCFDALEPMGRSSSVIDSVAEGGPVCVLGGGSPPFEN
jgi:hypothetical protein